MAATEYKTADQAYEAAKNDISNLMGFLECELTKKNDVITWPMYGSLRHVRQNLIETLAFLSGIDEKNIEGSLEDMHHSKNK